MPTRRAKRNQPPGGIGFTITELLVTILIISVLSALTLNGLARAFETARSNQCMSNLRQIGIAAALWTGEHDGNLVPFAAPSQDTYNGMGNWTGLLAPYMGNNTTNRVFKAANELPAAVCPLNKKRFGYGQNFNLSPWNGAIRLAVSLKTAAVTAPENTVYFADEVTVANPANQWTDNTWLPFLQGKPNGTAVKVNFAHRNNTANVLWVDGHVTSETTNAPFTTFDPNTWTYYYWSGKGP